MEKTRYAKLERIGIFLIIGIAVLALLTTSIVLGWPGCLIIIFALAIIGGLAAFLLLKNLWARIAGLVLCSLGIFWLLFLPIWLMQRFHP
jgi:hypothetical protein